MRGTALMIMLMLVPFSLIVLDRALAIQAASAVPFCTVKFDCGCGMGEVFICHKLLENGVCIFLSAWLLAGGGKQFCARYSVLKSS